MADKGRGIAPILDNKLFVVVIFILLGVALYQSGFDAPWYLDDGNSIVYNPMIKDLAQSFSHIFRPRGVAYVSFAANYHFAGMSPYWFRVTNVAIHIGASLLVWRLLARLYPRTLFSLFGGLLFLVHPLQTQAVTYIVQRLASMAAFFFLLSVYFYLRGRECEGERRSFYWQAGALLSAFLACWTKQNTIFLPIIILLVDYAFIDLRNFSIKRSFWRILPFCIISIIVVLQQFHIESEILSIVNVAPTQSGGALTEGETFLSQQGGGFAFLNSMSLRYFATQLIVFWVYAKLFFLPTGQMLDYYGSVPIVSNVINIMTFFSVLGWIIIFVAIHYCRLWNRRVLFGFAWILLTLALESSFIPLDPVFEHRMYLPFFGVIIVVYELFVCRIPSLLAVRLAVVILVALSVLTAQRNALWANPVAFWHDNAEKNPLGTRVMVILANAYLNRGELVSAEEWYTKALVIESNSSDPKTKIRSSTPLDSMGSIRFQQGRMVEAQDFFERALQNNPKNSYAAANLGRLFIESGEKEKGRSFLEQAFSVDPLNRAAIGPLLEIYSEPGLELEAEKFYRQALAANPHNDQIRVALGLLLDKTGRAAEGVEVLQVVLEQYPEEAKYFYYYGLCALHAGDENAYRVAHDRLQILSPVFFDKLVRNAEKANK